MLRVDTPESEAPAPAVVQLEYGNIEVFEKVLISGLVALFTDACIEVT